jgi:hypothetical protein
MEANTVRIRFLQAVNIRGAISSRDLKIVFSSNEVPLKQTATLCSWNIQMARPFLINLPHPKSSAQGDHMQPYIVRLRAAIYKGRGFAFNFPLQLNWIYYATNASGNMAKARLC